jgi:AraC family transcriptional regulator of adaptative response/methylated-DNA-[protein]-cysteine methyltransferase
VTLVMDRAGVETSHFTNKKIRQNSFEIQFVVNQSWLGWTLIVGTSQGICMIAFADTSEALEVQLHHSFSHTNFRENDPIFVTWVEQVLTFIETPQQAFNFPLDIQGTAFQKQVWNTLQTIPAGTTASYKEIAQKIGNPKAVRAVARACASNLIAVAIPCHRVVRSDGTLSGYRWGCDRKQALLERELQFL